ncbi:MAG: DUF4855 domain-containing protein [Alistipes sp.]|nr:DUF4855 domain-containing protein [Alistipes sp.]
MNIRKGVALFALAAALFSTASCTKSVVGRDEVRDLVLIYDGGDHRKINWNKEKFAPYVSTDVVDGKEQWLYDGFLFLEIICNDERGYATGYRKGGAQKENWIGLIDQYLTPGRDIAALNDAIGEARERIGGEFHRRKIVLSLPEPLLGQTDWGELDGQKLDFNVDADRIKACKWYIDLLIERFKEAELENVQLCGFYWLAEHVTETITFVKAVSDYIHEKELDFYWIPYFKANGYDKWQQWGFDHAYLQPNHFFNTSVPDSRIDETCKLAKAANLSLEMEFDERVLQRNGDRGCRMAAYIDSYEKNGVFENNNVAYYQGGHAWHELKSGSEQDQGLYKRLAKIIVKRQKEFYESK